MRNSEKQKYGKVRHNHSKGTKFQDYCIDNNGNKNTIIRLINMIEKELILKNYLF